MGSRSSTDTLVRIFVAFMRQRTWAQAELARECRVRVPALRRLLLELSEHGVPLVAEADHPHVYWSVPARWFPGGVLLEGESVGEALRLLMRLPKTKQRDHLLRLLIGVARGSSAPGAAIVPPAASHEEEEFLPVVEDAAARRVPLRLRYYSARRGTMDDVRHVSVQRVFPGPPARMAAVCHREDVLKWFRVERIARASLDEGERFRDTAPGAVDAFVTASLDGYHGPDAAAVECSFFVREPESRWVEKNLPGRDQMRIERLSGGTRLSCATAGLPVLARFVVGLGDAAHAETPELAAAVRDLAMGALAVPRVPARTGRPRKPTVRKTVASLRARG